MSNPDPLDLQCNSVYHTPFATNTTLLFQLLLSLSQQKHAPKTKTYVQQEYDYIIVGGGSAGSVVASRLSEIPCVSVLLLEAGKSPPLITDVPVLARSFWFSDLDWKYKTVQQKNAGFGLVNNQVIWPSGKAVGGSSIINAMLDVRGNKINYDSWALNGAVGWSYSDTKPYFLKQEDNRDPEYLANGYHVVDGPMSVHKPGYQPEIKKSILETAQHLGYRVVDSNGHTQTGFYDHQGTLRNGQRCSTAKAYLVPAENRTNLDIVANAFVEKIQIQSGRATGVLVKFDDKIFDVTAKREVIMSAGTVNTAQLLMLSGIGPRKHLEELGIPVEADLPVGDNLQDHCAVPLIFELDPQIPSILQKGLDQRSFVEYINSRTGPLSSTEAVSLMAFLNKDPHPRFDFPDFQLFFAEIPIDIPRSQFGLKPEVFRQVYGPYENSTLYTCYSQILHPNSRGTVRLRTNQPSDPPLIDPNYFFDPKDLQDVVEGLKMCLKIERSGPMKRLGSKPLTTTVPGCEQFRSDEHTYLGCVAQHIVITTSHPVGTAKMGNPYDPSTVVDPQLRVKGIDGLRVVDASIMPTIPFGNTNVPTIMIAEKASDIIKTTINCDTQTPSTSQNEFPSSPYFQRPPLSPGVII